MLPLTQHDIIKNTQLLVKTIQQYTCCNQLDEVKRLIPLSNPKANESRPLQIAVACGLTEIVQLLIPVSNPKALDSKALKVAADKGFFEIVQLLIPVSDPKIDDSLALHWAVESGHYNIVKLLIPVSDYKSVLQEFEDCYDDVRTLKQCIAEYEILQQHERLSEQITLLAEHTKKTCSKRKI